MLNGLLCVCFWQMGVLVATAKLSEVGCLLRQVLICQDEEGKAPGFQQRDHCIKARNVLFNEPCGLDLDDALRAVPEGHSEIRCVGPLFAVTVMPGHGEWLRFQPCNESTYRGDHNK